MAKQSLEPAVMVADDLTIRLAHPAVQLTASQGLRLAETLARKSFHQLLVEEARHMGPVPELRS